MLRTLDQLKKNDAGRIRSVRGSAAVTQRLLALGLLPGGMIQVVGMAPLGDPITIDGPGGRVSLRRSEAIAIEIETPVGWVERSETHQPV